jgi:phosphoglycerate dehydrogenase-like enzyme
MTFTLVMIPPQEDSTAGWPDRLRDAIPGVTVLRPPTIEEAAQALPNADAAYGRLPEDLLRHAEKLRWLQAPAAGPAPGFYHQALIDHPVTVTNMRDTYTDHVATHTLAMVLALARDLPRYVREQSRSTWAPDWDPGSVLTLAESTAVIVGTGALGAEIGRLLAAFGTRVIGVDPRVTEPPPGFAEIHPSSELDSQLPFGDLVIIAAPHTPQTEGMINAERLALLKPSAYFINIGRGPIVRLDALVDALEAGRLRGAALDVFDPEPLPAGHPLWQRPDVLITPHVAGAGPHADERRFAVLLENSKRFARGEDLINVVDKRLWH